GPGRPIPHAAGDSGGGAVGDGDAGGLPVCRPLRAGDGRALRSGAPRLGSARKGPLDSWLAASSGRGREAGSMRRAAGRRRSSAGPRSLPQTVGAPFPQPNLFNIRGPCSLGRAAGPRRRRLRRVEAPPYGNTPISADSRLVRSDPLTLLWLQFIVSALAIVGAGALVARYGAELSERTRLGGLWIGTILVAFVTSLPEAVATVS